MARTKQLARKATGGKDPFPFYRRLFCIAQESEFVQVPIIKDTEKDNSVNKRKSLKALVDISLKLGPDICLEKLDESKIKHELANGKDLKIEGNIGYKEIMDGKLGRDYRICYDGYRSICKKLLGFVSAKYCGKETNQNMIVEKFERDSLLIISEMVVFHTIIEYLDPLSCVHLSLTCKDFYERIFIEERFKLPPLLVFSVSPFSNYVKRSEYYSKVDRTSFYQESEDPEDSDPEPEERERKHLKKE